jgi:hypothetical protein
MKTYGGVDVQTHVFLTSALAEGEWSASRPGRFTPGERAPSIHWIGGWVSPRSGLDAMKKKEISCRNRKSNLDSSTVQPVASRYIG